MKYSYYIGFELPGRLSDRITALQKKLRDPIETVDPLQPHITLLPPPAVRDSNPADIAPQIKKIAKGILPIQINLTGITTFGGRAVALQVDSDEIYELQRELVSVLPVGAELKYYPNPTFLPHVTIVQAIRGKTLPSKIIAEYREELLPLLPAAFTVHRITLFSQHGPRKHDARKP